LNFTEFIKDERIQKAMVHHVNNTCDAFYALAIDGLPKQGLSVIDHGVAGGLLLLQINTLFFVAFQALTGC
jgi:hypothetical protein